jgi:2-keto-4-pentenoate hydratase
MKPLTGPWEDPRIKAGMTAQLAQRRSRIAEGEKPLGWKIGFGAPAALERFRLSAPLFGYLMQGALLPSGATASVKGWTQPVAEPEIGARVGADLAPGSDAVAARAAIASLTPAIELADLEFSATDADVEKVLVRNIFQRHVLLSEKSRAGGDTSGLSTHVYRRGKLAAETATPEAITGKVADVLVHLADLLGAFGERLRAGDLIICGSTVPPPFIEVDETEFSYTLAPIGDVSVRFTR